MTSTAGLVGVTYGLIEAGRNGWTDANALAPMIAGLALLVGFFFWEYLHRLIGRLIGLVFALPLLWFAWRRAIPP